MYAAPSGLSHTADVPAAAWYFYASISENSNSILVRARGSSIEHRILYLYIYAIIAAHLFPLPEVLSVEFVLEVAQHRYFPHWFLFPTMLATANKESVR